MSSFQGLIICPHLFLSQQGLAIQGQFNLGQYPKYNLFYVKAFVIKIVVALVIVIVADYYHSSNIWIFQFEHRSRYEPLIGERTNQWLTVRSRDFNGLANFDSQDTPDYFLSLNIAILLFVTGYKQSSWMAFFQILRVHDIVSDKHHELP